MNRTERAELQRKKWELQRKIRERWNPDDIKLYEKRKMMLNAINKKLEEDEEYEKERKEIKED